MYVHIYIYIEREREREREIYICRLPAAFFCLAGSRTSSSSFSAETPDHLPSTCKLCWAFLGQYEAPTKLDSDKCVRFDAIWKYVFFHGGPAFEAPASRVGRGARGLCGLRGPPPGARRGRAGIGLARSRTQVRTRAIHYIMLYHIISYTLHYSILYYITLYYITLRYSTIMI